MHCHPTVINLFPLYVTLKCPGKMGSSRVSCEHLKSKNVMSVKAFAIVKPRELHSWRASSGCDQQNIRVLWFMFLLFTIVESYAVCVRTQAMFSWLSYWLLSCLYAGPVKSPYVTPICRISTQLSHSTITFLYITWHFQWNGNISLQYAEGVKVYFANIVHVVENSIPLLYRCAFFPRTWWRMVYLYYTAVLSSRGHVIPTIKQLTMAYHCDPHLQLPAIRLQIYTQKCVKHTSAADPDSHNCVSCKGFWSQLNRST